MSSLVRELQRDALDNSIPASSILRKALVVARKLSNEEFKVWCEMELKGYTDGKEIPQYRFVETELKARNPVLGLIPVMMPPQMADVFARKAISQPIAEIEDLCANPTSEGFMIIPVPKSIEGTLVRMLNGYYPVVVASRAAFMGILDAVRNIVLDWALKLEEQGVLGEDMSFSDHEKQVAPTVTYNINQMIGSQIQHGSVGSTQSMTNQGVELADVTKFVQELRDAVKDIQLHSEKKAELESEIQTIEIQARSPKPKFNIIKESLTSVRNILEGAAGSAIATKLLEQLPALLLFLSTR